MLKTEHSGPPQRAWGSHGVLMVLRHTGFTGAGAQQSAFRGVRFKRGDADCLQKGSPHRNKIYPLSTPIIADETRFINPTFVKYRSIFSSQSSREEGLCADRTQSFETWHMGDFYKFCVIFWQKCKK